MEIPKKTHRPVASPGTISTCENPGVTRTVIETGSPWLGGEQANRSSTVVPLAAKSSLAFRRLPAPLSRFIPVIKAPTLQERKQETCFRKSLGAPHLTCYLHIFLQDLSLPRAIKFLRRRDEGGAASECNVGDAAVARRNLPPASENAKWDLRGSSPKTPHLCVDETTMVESHARAQGDEHLTAEHSKPSKILTRCSTRILMWVSGLHCRGVRFSRGNPTYSRVFNPGLGWFSAHPPSTQLGEPGSIPGGVAPGFSHVRIVSDNATGRRGFLGNFPFPLPLRSGAAPYSPLLTIIGSQDLDVKSRPNISIPTL
ncbi:hypothetical protein PR048_007808 [Dryococelus australis]|uniref:Uncharacterized protein n=1 Tax=Dryococelus australis TaxID=614101 RepID=A0ABQ9HW62_9NEOP|nr:hypothetical protein PR048_007808 [Dryococelus australis]